MHDVNYLKCVLKIYLLGHLVTLNIYYLNLASMDTFPFICMVHPNLKTSVMTSEISHRRTLRNLAPR